MSSLTAFCLSPGITVELTDLVLVEFAVVIGFAYLISGTRGFELAFAANALLLGLIKFVTDYTDRSDLPVALSGILGGVFAGVLASRQLTLSFGLRVLGRFGGFVFAAAGAIKIVTDFCDPFDILLGAVAVVAGGLLWLHTGRTGSLRAPPRAEG